MKKKLFAVFLALALLLAALAGCGQENGGSSRSSGGEEEERLLEKGWYRVLDEDDELAGYLEVKSSKITVYDETADEEDTLRYEYNAKKDLYAIEDGELFGSGEFTVEKSKKKLTLTADGDKYTLEEIDKEDMPGPGTAKTPGFDDPADGEIGTAKTPGFDDPAEGVELPAGCYAVYEDGSIIGYMKITDSTLTEYSLEGEPFEDVPYSYDRDGNCVLNPYDDYTFEWQFFHEDGDYYLDTSMEYLLLEPIRESEIPEYTGSMPAMAWYSGDNGSISLRAFLPKSLYSNIDADHDDGVFSAMAAAYDADAAAELVFYSVLSSGDNLKEAVSTAKGLYTGAYGSDAELLYGFLRDSMVTSGLEQGYLLDEYLGDDLDYSLLEDSIEINGVDWRYCDVYLSADGAEGYVSLMFWMEGGDMAVVVLGGIAEDADNAAEMYNRVFEIMFSLELLS